MPQGSMGSLAAPLFTAACIMAGAVAQSFEPMEFVIPLYIAPTYINGTIAAQWVALHDTAQTGVTVFGILNPASGPGTITAPNYTETIDYVKSAGAKLICYVATTYGEKAAEDVQSEISAYEELYPGACDGIFFDEAPYLLGDMSSLYIAHNAYAHATFDSVETARVVFNTGQAADEQYFDFYPPAEVLGFENYYKTVRQLGFPETKPGSTADQNMILLHSATELANKTELIQPFVDKAYCKGWGTIYVTDDAFEGGNPWDDPPTFWDLLVEATMNIPSVDSCNLDGLKVLAPLLGSNIDDFETIIASADPGDYGDRITVALDVQITTMGESTDRAAAVRDSGAKVLCYIDATGYNDNITALEDEVTVFTYYPLNEICAGFFFGGLDVMLALEDTLAIQSLYAKTQATFLQATVVFAPSATVTLFEEYTDDVYGDDGDEFSFSFSFSFSYDYDYGYDYGGDNFFFDHDADWEDTNPSSTFYLPWDDFDTDVDVAELTEVLSLGLPDGSTMGDVIVASTFDEGASIPTAVSVPENNAAIITGYSSSPETVMLDLFDKDWGYGYVTEYDHFEYLASQWDRMVEVTKET